MRETPIGSSKPVAEPAQLPQRLVDIYSLLASLARQRRAATLNDPDGSTGPDALTQPAG